MKSLRIYIASSWKNQHAVEMLTALLRARGHTVLSFVENNHGEQAGHLATEKGTAVPFEQWVTSERGRLSFEYDTNGATRSDAVVYIGPSGCDAWAEVGAAWASGVPIYGLWSKGESVGLMRRMMAAWANDYTVLLHWIDLSAAESDGEVEAANEQLARCDRARG